MTTLAGRGLLLVAVLLTSVGYLDRRVVWAGEPVHLVVELKEVGGDDKASRSWREGVREIRKISDRAPREYVLDGQVRRAADLRRWRVVAVTAEQAEATAKALTENPAVKSVHRENIYEEARLPDDPLFADQWALLNTPLADIQAPAAWDKTTGVSDTVIAVIDGGVDLDHEDLRGRIWRNDKEVPNNGRDDDGNGYVDDIHGWDFVAGQAAGAAYDHGTHVAGLAAASGNNGVGVAGVDWGAKIMPVRVLSASGLGREEWIVRGIEYAVVQGADVINMSLVGSESPALAAAVENAYAAGVVVVAAAGNSGWDTGERAVYPACADGGADMVLGVGALDADGDRASFSNYGACVNVAAPGRRLLSTTVGDRYRNMTGTSMSAPLAAGVVGLYLAMHPQASPAAVIAAITNADGGKLNAAKVVGVNTERWAGPPVPTPAGGATARQGEPDLAVTMTGPDEVQPGNTAQYEVRVDNSGAEARGVSINNRFDRDLSFVPGTSSAGCAADGREVTCAHGSLPAGETASFGLVFQLANDARCGSRLREDINVYADERGRSRRQAGSAQVVSDVSCAQ